MVVMEEADVVRMVEGMLAREREAAEGRLREVVRGLLLAEREREAAVSAVRGAQCLLLLLLLVWMQGAIP
eukprot:COSAG02_NODE_1534_length_12054_cov_22.784442_14_plen_70_part_00